MDTSWNPRHGFTLLELLALLALIAVLASVLLPVFSAAREGVNRAQCAANLRQIGIAVHRYAQENENQLPASTRGGNWSWDLSVPLSQALLETGAVEQDTFYCPSNGSVPQEDLWNFGVSSDGESGYRITEYVLLLPGTAGVHPEDMNSQLGEHVRGSVEPRGGLRYVVVPENERKLAVDAVISFSSSVDSDFMGIPGGLLELHRTNHMSGDRPSGGNALFLDGSVRWRDFSEMEARTNGPYFWW